MKKILFLFVIFALLFEVGCEEKSPTPCFNFYSESIDQGKLAIVGELIEFENCSENADSYLWDFGDGETSTLMNPKHSYDEMGIYQVTLEATNEDGKESTSQEIEIQGTLTGTWEGALDLDGMEFGIIFNIEQEESQLSGSFSFDDGSGFVSLSSTSKIIGKNVTIDFTISEPGYYPMVFKFTGEVNNSFDEMEGTYTITMSSSSASGAWYASKAGTKSARKSGDGGGLDELLNKLK